MQVKQVIDFQTVGRLQVTEIRGTYYRIIF